MFYFSDNSSDWDKILTKGFSFKMVTIIRSMGEPMWKSDILIYTDLHVLGYSPRNNSESCPDGLEIQQSCCMPNPSGQQKHSHSHKESGNT